MYQKDLKILVASAALFCFIISSNADEDDRGSQRRNEEVRSTPMPEICREHAYKRIPEQTRPLVASTALLAMFWILVSSFVCTAVAQNCNGGLLTAEERAAVLKQHNEYRSKLVKGEAGYGAPGGRNVFELSYDCKLELSAQKWADRCKWEHSGTKDTGENLFQSFGGKPTTAQSLIAASDRWWKELADNNFQGDTYYSGYGGAKGTLGHWSQMAWGTTSAIGCAVKQCSFGTFVVCHYQAAGNFRGKKIYETGGNGCGSDADCKSKKCNTTNRLCVKTGPLCEDKFSNCKDLKPFCGTPWNPHIDKGCPETCGKC